MNIAVGSVASATALASSSALTLAIPATPDPILAVIDRYKTAVATRVAALSATWGCGAPKQFPKDGPESIAADAIHTAAFNREWEVFEELFTTMPTTVGGMDGIKIKRRLARYKNKMVALDIENMITDSIKRDLRMRRKLTGAVP